ncbi:MAG: ParB N-terminal domain-containing protein [Desulfobacteraceae bacterium]|nr:ParB N-terminal domain-containing protein [Desulfobacteraceae bacterium]
MIIMQSDFINISELNVQDPFSSIFPIGNETLESIQQNMETNGFDEVFPIIVWEGKNIVVDGHTRFNAAKAVGLKEVPVQFKTFESEDDAILYSFHIQRNRRNISDEDILNCLALLDTIHGSTPMDGNKEKLNKKETNEMRANQLGISPHKVDKARKVMEHGNDEIRESINSGEKSINKAFQQIQDDRRESGEIKGATTTGLGRAAKYTQTLGKFLKELTRIKEDGWQDISQEKALADLESVKQLIESDYP